MLAHPDDLIHHSVCVAAPSPGAALPVVWLLYRGDGRFAANSADLARAMAVDGIHIVALDTGRLQRVLPERRTRPMRVHAMTDTRHLTAHIRLFIDSLEERLGQPQNGAQVRSGQCNDVPGPDGDFA